MKQSEATGTIMRHVSGFYDVWLDGQQTIVRCRARGLFKNVGVTPLVGDDVRIEQHAAAEGTVMEVFPRRTMLIRPPVANVNLAVLVFSLTEPDLHLLLLDKFLAHIEYAGLSAVIVLTKQDLYSPSPGEEADALSPEAVIAQYEQVGYPVLLCNGKENTGIQAVADLLRGQIAVFAGQSGVGKSSIINQLAPGLQLETGEVSAKLGRGKHTTRHVELVSLPGGGIVADTPGFSQLDFTGWEAEQLASCFKEFPAYAATCKYRGCLHQGEPSCQVKHAVQSGGIAESRYEHYLLFLQQIKEQRRRY